MAGDTAKVARVVRGGPLVMNTREEIQQAFDDYRSGKLF